MGIGGFFLARHIKKTNSAIAKLTEQISYLKQKTVAVDNNQIFLALTPQIKKLIAEELIAVSIRDIPPAKSIVGPEEPTKIENATSESNDNSPKGDATDLDLIKETKIDMLIDEFEKRL